MDAVLQALAASAAVIIALALDWPCAAAGAALGLAALKIPYGTLALPAGSLAIAAIGLFAQSQTASAATSAWAAFGAGVIAAGAASIGIFSILCERE